MIRHILNDKELNNNQKIALIDTTLNPENGKPSQVKKQIDEFKKKHSGTSTGTRLFYIARSTLN